MSPKTGKSPKITSPLSNIRKSIGSGNININTSGSGNINVNDSGSPTNKLDKKNRKFTAISGTSTSSHTNTSTTSATNTNSNSNNNSNSNSNATTVQFHNTERIISSLCDDAHSMVETLLESLSESMEHDRESGVGVGYLQEALN